MWLLGLQQGVGAQKIVQALISADHQEQQSSVIGALKRAKFLYRLKKLVSIALQTGSFNCIYFVFVTTIFFSVISWSIAVTNLQCHWIRSRFNSCATFSIKVEYVKDGILLYRIDLSSRRATTWIRNIDLGRIIFLTLIQLGRVGLFYRRVFLLERQPWFVLVN